MFTIVETNINIVKILYASHNSGYKLPSIDIIDQLVIQTQIYVY